MDNQPNKTPLDDEEHYSETAADTTPLQSEQTPTPTSPAEPMTSPFQESGDGLSPHPVDNESPIAPTPLASIVAPSPKSNKKKWYSIGVIAAAVIVLIVAAVLVYFLWYQKPEKVLSDAVGQFVAAKNMTFTGSLSTGEESALTLSYSGTINGKSSAVDMTAKVDASGEKFSVPVSFSGDPQQFYFKISQLQALEKKFVTPYLSMYGVPAAQQAQIDTLVKDIDGQWYKVTPDDLTDDSASKSKTSCISNQVEKIRTDAPTQKELIALYKAHPLFTITKSLGTKDGSLGYEVKPVSDHNAKPFFEALSKSKFFKDLQKCDSSIKIDLSDFDDKTADTDKSTIQVWVNQWSHQLTSISFDSNDSSSPAKFTFTPKVGDVKPVETPKNAKSIDDLKNEFEQLTTGLMGGTATSDI